MALTSVLCACRRKERKLPNIVEARLRGLQQCSGTRIRLWLQMCLPMAFPIQMVGCSARCSVRCPCTIWACRGNANWVSPYPVAMKHMCSGSDSHSSHGLRCGPWGIHLLLSLLLLYLHVPCLYTVCKATLAQRLAHSCLSMPAWDWCPDRVEIKVRCFNTMQPAALTPP